MTLMICMLMRVQLLLRTRYLFCVYVQKVLNKDASFFFVPLVSQLVNDESSTCRQMIAEAIKTLLQKVHTS